ncbi:MAG: hypothetical protein LUG51_11575, partial [Tannerellaceae bacterium]|nr:hypothetical protein [Tannerellaceae bacterium]
MMRRRSKNKHLRVDCVALHHFEELSSGDACGNPVDYYKSARLGDGKFSKGLAGGIAYIHTAGQANVYRKDFTIECWVKVSGGIQIDAGLRINLKSSAHTSFYYCQVGVNFAFLEEGTGKVSLLLGNSNQTDWVNSTQLLG